MNCSVYKMVCSKRLRWVLYDIICIVRLRVVCLSCGVIVTDRDLALMNAVKTMFPECTNLLCRFHIDKNVKAKCKSLIGQKRHGSMPWMPSLVDCRSEHQFDDCFKKFEIVCFPWPMIVDYVNETSIIPHKEKFVTT